MSASTITLVVTLVLAAVAVYGAYIGIKSGATAKAAIERADQLEKLRVLDKETAERTEAACNEKVALLTRRVDDLQTGWLDGIGPKVAATLAPHVVAELGPRLVEVVREAMK